MKGKHKNKLAIFVFAILTCGLMSCSHITPAPVENLTLGSGAQSESSPTSYTVKSGDTLFSIAWQHSLDYEELARINQIKDNIIYPGQVLQLRTADDGGYFDVDNLIAALNRDVLRNPISAPASENVQSSGTGKSGSKASGKKGREKSSKNSKSGKSEKTASTKDGKKTTNKGSSERKSSTSAQIYVSDKSLNWIWPTDGKILATFSDKSNANRGLDIAGSKGQAVRAAAQGQVVYKGDGLRGYGNLVIIKHNANYLSAYAHNSKIHVSENEIVKAGQRIAEIGSTGALRNKLHFEIRYKGKPVDPLNYLPQK